MSHPDSGPADEASDKGLRISRTVVLQVLLVLVCGILGFYRLPREALQSYLQMLLMIALPLAASIIAGSLSREFIERPIPSYAIVIALPLMHVACLLGLASLVRSRYTIIEVPTDIHPAVIWSEWPMHVSILVAEIPCVAFVLIALRLRTNKK